MTLTWISVLTRTGEVMANWPDLSASQGWTRTLGQASNCSATFPITAYPSPPPGNWLAASLAERTMFVGLDPDGTPAWCGIVTKRQRAGNGSVQLALSTPESYLGQRYIRDTYQRVQGDRLQIGADLLNAYVIDGASGRNGLPLRVAVQGVGLPRDANWQDSDDKTILSAFGDLGFEWTITPEWVDQPDGTSRIGLVATLAERLGAAAPVGLEPDVTLTWPGSLSQLEIEESWADGATDVMATSTGQGSVRPQSDHQTVTATDLPTVERRFSAGSSITSLATLNAAAAADLASRSSGTTAFTVAVPLDNRAAWRMQLGDDVGIDASGPDWPDEPSYIRRVAALKYDATSVTPTLV